MASGAQHLSLYGDLRGKILARHFALGRYFRANHPSEKNVLGFNYDPHTPADDPEGGYRSEKYTSIGDLLALDHQIAIDQTLTELEKERWRINVRQRDNPLLFDGLLLSCLSIEHYLGGRDALPVIKLTLATIGSLFKFGQSTDHFAGYIIRWDPVTCDSWYTAVDNGRIVPKTCAHFRIDENGEYLYSTPRNFPGYPVSRERFRNWEPSFDELTGLLLAYDSLFKFVKDDVDVQAEVIRQVNCLGDYLAEHSYLMVRPGGGFSFRGAAGPSVALEFPFDQVFKRITGNDYGARTGFNDVLNKAGVWEILKDPINTAKAIAVAISTVAAVATYIGCLLASSPYVLILPAIVGLIGGPLSLVIAEFAALAANGDRFDVSPGELTSFAVAYLLQLLPSRSRFLRWMWGTQLGIGGYSRAFPQFFGMTALADPATFTYDPDPTVRNAVIDWCDAKKALTPDDVKYAVSPLLSAAVAVLLRGTTLDQQLLRSRLDEAFDAHAQSVHRIPEGGLHEIADGSRDIRFCGRCGTPKIDDDPDWIATQDPRYGLHYMVALAVSWLRNDSAANGQASPMTGIGDLSFDPNLVWPTPVVPKDVFSAEYLGPTLGVLTGRGQDNVSPSAGIPLFSGATSDSTPPVPPPQIPPIDPSLAIEETFVILENDGPVDTGIDLQQFDTLFWNADANDTIWAGVWFTGRNGPEGWTTSVVSDTKFPLHTGNNAHPYGLIYNVGGAEENWSYAGSAGYLVICAGDPGGRLFLSINDDTPGNGNGQFTCTVRVARRSV